MFNLSDILNTLDAAAKDTFDEEGEAQPSATYIRSLRKGGESVGGTGDVAPSSVHGHVGEGEGYISRLQADSVAATPIVSSQSSLDAHSKSKERVDTETDRDLMPPPQLQFTAKRLDVKENKDLSLSTSTSTNTTASINSKPRRDRKSVV